MVRLLCNLQQKGLHTKTFYKTLVVSSVLWPSQGVCCPQKKKKPSILCSQLQQWFKSNWVSYNCIQKHFTRFWWFHQSCDQAKECAAFPKSIYFVSSVIYNKSNCAGHHPPPPGLNFLLNFPRMNPQLQEWLNYANNHFDIMDQQMCIEHQYIGYSLMISNNYHTSFATVAYMTQWDNWSK